jgi:HlyD family secretion protein
MDLSHLFQRSDFMVATAEITESSRPALTQFRRRERATGLRRLWLWLLLPALAAGGAWGASRVAQLMRPAEQPIEPRAIPIGVSALGRLAPHGEVIKVAPVSGADGGRVDRLLVDVGKWVQAGQVVAILDPYRRREAAVLQAQAEVGVAQAKLAQVRAGPKLEEVQAKEALINRWSAEVQAAERDLGRSSTLFKRAAGSRQEVDDRTLKYEQARDSLDQAKAELAALKAIRPADIKVAEAELVQAQAGLELARAELEAAEVRSPIKGQVLRIHVWPGERVGDQGILEIGDTHVMHAVAEVYEQDVGKVAIGQKAKVRIPTLGEDLTGVVVRKDLVVSRKVVFSNDPVADIDARVVEVRIELGKDDSPKVAGLSNARCEIVVDIGGPSS